VTPPIVNRNEPRFGSSPVRNSIPERNPAFADGSVLSDEDSGELILVRLYAAGGVVGVDGSPEHLYEV
jgi:hypothetical protein